jgi:hypothetical protein
MGREPDRKGYPPSLVDAEAALAFPISWYYFKTIAGQSSHISHLTRRT